MKWIACSLVMMLALSSCKPTCWSGGEPLRKVEKLALRAAADDFHKAKGVRVYHGLLHPKRDALDYRRQLLTKPNVEFEGFRFHKAPEPVSGQLVEDLMNLYCDEESHQALAAPKTTCAGFHPDYALVWTRGGKQRVLQICYGCHEWKFFGPGGVLHTDINEPAYFEKLIRWLPPKP